MRVTCPSCHAVYEAPDAEIGVGGRVVECSACGARWMQPGPDAEPVADPAGRSAVPGLAAAAADMAALRSRSDESAAPAAAPDAPADAAPGPEATPEEAEAAPARDAAEDPASVRAPEAAGTDPGAAAWRGSPDVAGTGSPAPVAPIASTTVAPTTPAAEVAPRDHAEADDAPRRRNRVATIDAQSLSAELRGASYDDEEAPRGRSRGGAAFALGLLLALLVSALGAVAYLQPAVIGDAFPEAYPWLDRWADIVNQGRAAVDRIVASLADLASPLIDRIR